MGLVFSFLKKGSVVAKQENSEKLEFNNGF
jgi:hypothetical protein